MSKHRTVGSPVLAEEEDGLLQLELEALGLHQLQGAPVHLHNRVTT